MTDPAEAAKKGGDYYRVCSVCRTPIGFGASYYRCSVSTCNRNRLPLFFCKLSCFSAHVPEARHRDAWAEETDAPTKAAYEAELRDEEAAEARAQERKERERERGETMTAGEVPKDVLIVVSKMKAYVKARSGMNTSDGVVDVLSDYVRKVCDDAIEEARRQGRKTVLDRDFK
jgi:histone H3/H4